MVLGRAATARLVALNAGTAALLAGSVGGGPALAAAGAVLAGAAVLASVALAAVAVRPGTRVSAPA